MHETNETTVSALPKILAAAKQKGLRLVSIPELLALDPPTEVPGARPRRRVPTASASSAGRRDRDAPGPRWRRRAFGHHGLTTPASRSRFRPGGNLLYAQVPAMIA